MTTARLLLQASWNCVADGSDNFSFGNIGYLKSQQAVDVLKEPLLFSAECGWSNRICEGNVSLDFVSSFDVDNGDAAGAAHG